VVWGSGCATMVVSQILPWAQLSAIETKINL
jgi:hypothetical protein